MSSEATDEKVPLKTFDANKSESQVTEDTGVPVEDSPPNYTKALGIAKIQEEIKNAKKESSNQAFYLWKVCCIMSGSGVSLACLLVFSALPIAMIVIGSLYLHRCPFERFIPIWLIVFGCFSLVHVLIQMIRTCITCCKKADNDEAGQYANQGGGCCEGLIVIFLFAWLIAGSVWVFRAYRIYYSPICQANPAGCCEAVPLLFSFGSIIAIYVVGLLSLVVMCCCICCCACCFAGAAAAFASSKPPSSE